MVIDKAYLEARKAEAEAQRNNFLEQARTADGAAQAFAFLLKELDKPPEPPQD